AALPRRESGASGGGDGSDGERRALARRYKQKGYKIRFRLGRGLVRTRMYSSLEELCTGWAHNLALLFPDARQLARRRSTELFLLLISLALSAIWTAQVSLRDAHAGFYPHWIPNLVGILLWLFTLSNFALFYACV